MKIKLTRKAGGHNAGDTITVTPLTAEQLISNGYAEEIKTGRPKKTTDTGVGGTPSEPVKDRRD